MGALPSFFESADGAARSLVSWFCVIRDEVVLDSSTIIVESL